MNGYKLASLGLQQFRQQALKRLLFLPPFVLARHRENRRRKGLALTQRNASEPGTADFLNGSGSRPIFSSPG